MKRFPAPSNFTSIFILITLLVTLLFTIQPLAAGEDDSGLSIGLSLGIRPDMARTGKTITRDGTLPIGDGNMLKEVYGTTKVFMSDRDNLILYNSSQLTNSNYELLKDYEANGRINGGEVGLVIQYDLDDLIDWPMFIRSGFHYTSGLGTGGQSRTLGNVASQDPEIATVLILNGLDPSDFGGTWRSEWVASWYEIPFVLGFRIPIKGRTELYAGMGVNIMKGGFNIDFSMDEKYANAMGTYIDIENRTATRYYEDGPVNESVQFIVGRMGFLWLLGVQSEISSRFVAFFELNASATSRTIYNSKISAKSQKLLTLSQSEVLFQTDERWVKRLAFPVVLEGAAFRIGTKYYI